MKILENEVEIYFSESKTGYGNYEIIAKISYQNEIEYFNAITHRSDLIDEINEMIFNQKTFDEVQKFYYDNFYNLFEIKIIDFCYQIDIEE